MFGGIPFEHFANMGGSRGGGGGGGGGSPSEPVDTTKLYETLEVEKDATPKDIKKAYFRLSKLHHPDKGGDEHKFKEINAAYEILSDPEKRAKYDKYGLEGVDDDAGAASRGEDLFSMFFGGGGGRGRRSAGPRKGPSVQHPLKVSLEDLYNGKTVKLAVNRKVIVGDVKECTQCRGQGVIMEIRQLGPGMITQVQRACSNCQGQGNQAQYKQERKVLEVHIDKGMQHNQKITFRNMADEVPNLEPGDIHFVIQEKEHDLFKRKGADLLVTKDISLNQALTGFTWHLTHLDNRQLVIKTRPGEIIQCETRDEETGRVMPYITMVKGEGMPSLGNPFVKGNLYIAFHVKFPTTLTQEAIVTLRKVLPDPDYPQDMAVEPSDDAANAHGPEEHFMDSADLRHFGKGGAAVHSNEYDSDEDNDRQGAVQCQQS